VIRGGRGRLRGTRTIRGSLGRFGDACGALFSQFVSFERVKTETKRGNNVPVPEMSRVLMPCSTSFLGLYSSESGR